MPEVTDPNDKDAPPVPPAPEPGPGVAEVVALYAATRTHCPACGCALPA